MKIVVNAIDLLCVGVQMQSLVECNVSFCVELQLKYGEKLWHQSLN